MDEYVVRAAGAQDAAALLRLNETFNGPTGVTEAQVAWALWEREAELVYLALLGGQAVGFCCAQARVSFCYPAPTGEVTEMYVDPAHRRRGVARALLAAAEAGLRARGVGTATLLTGGGNAAAQAVYRACGYVPSGEIHHEKPL